MIGIVIFYIIFSFVGSVIFLFKNFEPVIMGILSLIAGFFLEFAFMRPDWVQDIFGFRITAGVIVAFIVLAFCWFIYRGHYQYI